MLKSSPYSISDLIKTLFGASLSILVLLYLTQLSHQLWIMAPFGATCVLLYAAAQSPLAQPKNVIVGHLVSAAIGLAFVHYLPINIITIALAVALAIVLMQLLGCVHPPAGANPLLILLSASSVHYGWDFLIFPVLTGAVLLVVIARLIHILQQQFIKYWEQDKDASPSLE
ncbi:HPP family protein [Acinetobacter sp. ME22]|uniref:HPP family protein n=1 Tax=Acinetobacter sp. ME22 TaxID=2904802 RepID=UPI001EDB4BDF|nr:HPP family protein [Acinetobacter sp. ME22]MCG2574391.1 HPP family protein [Acinetobacter sp. ME22]